MTATDSNTYPSMGPLDSATLSGVHAVIEFGKESGSSRDMTFKLAASIPFGREASLPKWDICYSVDWCFSLCLFLLTLPITALAAIWVLCIDPGNPFYFQRRAGRNLRPYTIFKIRTMRHAGPKAQFCSIDDDRILPGGQFLRKTRIDELPQLVNVLLGDMALIGPRPEQLPFVRNFLVSIHDYRLRFAVKPGITGLAQVTQGYVASEAGTRKKLKYDIVFIHNRSLRTWFAIAGKTLRVIVTGHGAR